jgi:uncharacterized protein YjbI with pentapeptide repeats
VTPRATVPNGDAALPLEHRIRNVLARGVRGNVAIVGPRGSGKTTAICHLAAALADLSGIAYIDRDTPILTRSTRDRLLIFTSLKDPGTKAVTATFLLSPWTDDDLIAYLAAANRDQCGSVMKRVLACDDRADLEGLPRLWRIVLDELAGDESIPDIGSALRRYEMKLLRPELYPAACEECLRRIRQSSEERRNTLLDHPVVSRALAADYLVTNWSQRQFNERLPRRIPKALIIETGRLVRTHPGAAGELLQILAGTDSAWHSTAASVLHAAGVAFRAPGNGPADLYAACLPGIHWPGDSLTKANLVRADLSDADLFEADLRDANLTGAQLHGADLRGARIDSVAFRGANISGAILSHASGVSVDFVEANLVDARLVEALLPRARFEKADITRTCLQGAQLQSASFESAQLIQTDFTGADLQGARFQRSNLREVVLTDAKMAGALVLFCDLQAVDLPSADFHMANLMGSDLTGARMPGANLNGANLTSTGLADVDWEGADLRDANFTGASFHMGSTRSGLVGSVIPCEGSKTGFYTDDFNEQDFKPPEEIRKANLCNTDLRGAKVEDVDFYLVDLRGARYTQAQAEHFARCGAILRTRVGG